MNQYFREKYIKGIQQSRLLDDVFFALCIADDKDNTALLIRILMGKDDLTILQSTGQFQIKNIISHSVTFDVYACDSEGKYYNIEVQRSNGGAIPKRARFHSSILDNQILRKNSDYSALPESYVIFICENDVFKAGLPVYHVERMILETESAFHDEAHIVYVNTEYVEKKKKENVSLSPLEMLMSDFRSTDPDEMYYHSFADKIRLYKNNPLGVRKMSSFMEEIYNDAIQVMEDKYGDQIAEYNYKIAELERERKESERKFEKELAEERSKREKELEEERGKREKQLAEELTKAQSDSRAVVMSAIRMVKDGIKAEKISEYIGMPLDEVKELAALIA